MTDNQNISIVIPAYNEADNLPKLINTIKTQYPSCEIIVIDDGSTDDTAKVADSCNVKVYRHPYNIGNGAAIKNGLRFSSGEIVVFLDGDGQHDPNDIKKLLEYIPDYDMVIGSRSLKDQATLFRSLANSVFNVLGSYVSNFPIKDLTSGFRAVKREIALEFIDLLPNTFSYPTTLTLGFLRSGRTIKFIPISSHKRQKGKSKISLFKDGARFFYIIVRICTIYSPMRIFFPLSILFFLLGLAYYLYTYMTQGRFTNMSALLFINSTIIFSLGLISEQICQIRYEKSSKESCQLSASNCQQTQPQNNNR
ncbi:MAG: glycosyltransferase family 2 protein [Deltaproteobacteria bacterium]